jgi:hypothetical protein
MRVISSHTSRLANGSGSYYRVRARSAGTDGEATRLDIDGLVEAAR